MAQRGCVEFHALISPMAVYIIPCFPRSERIRDIVSTRMETGSACMPGIFPAAFRISVMWGEKRLRSKGISCSASALRIRRATAVRGADSSIPAHHKSRKLPIPFRERGKPEKDTVARASMTRSLSGYSPINARVRCIFSRGVKFPRTPLSYIWSCADSNASFMASLRLIAINRRLFIVMSYDGYLMLIIPNQS